jgi:hypothetical protein
MSATQREATHLNEVARLKRTRDETVSTPDGRAGARPYQEEPRRPYDVASTWDGRQKPQLLDARAGWDPTVQTNLWLARQNSLTPTTSASGDENRRLPHGRGDERPLSKGHDAMEALAVKRQRLDFSMDSSRERMRGDPVPFGYELQSMSSRIIRWRNESTY